MDIWQIIALVAFYAVLVGICYASIVTTLPSKGKRLPRLHVLGLSILLAVVVVALFDFWIGAKAFKAF